VIAASVRWSVIASRLVAQADIGERQREQPGESAEPQDIGHGAVPPMGRRRLAGSEEQIGARGVKVRRRMERAGVKFAYRLRWGRGVSAR